MRQAVIHAFTKALDTVWIVMTPLCGVSLILGTPQISAALQNTGTNSSVPCVLATVLLMRHYTMKRIIVQEGKGNSDSGTPPGTVTPTSPVDGGEHSDTPQAIDEKRRSVSDLEKGLNGSEDGTVDIKGEKGDTDEGYVKKG